MSDQNDFLKPRKETSSQHHKEYLGMNVPEGYFEASKKSILDLIKEESPVRETPVFYLRRSFQVAASIALLVIMTVWFQYSERSKIEIASNDILIESLFVEDDNMNDFVEEILVSEVVEEADKEKEMEEIIINSLFVEDSLLDNYTNESLLDNLIL